MFKSMISFFKQQTHTSNTDTFNSAGSVPKTLGYWVKRALLIGVVLATMIVLFLSISMALIYPKLPSMESVTDYRPKIPLRVYTADNALIAEFGEERRTFVKIADVPKHMKQAILATEDDRLHRHYACNAFQPDGWHRWRCQHDYPASSKKFFSYQQ
jgi:membrane peptidoglycan carboxypeptidase